MLRRNSDTRSLVCAMPVTVTTWPSCLIDGEVDAFGRLLDQLVEQVHRHVAVGLQVFDRLLARLQRVDLGAQVGDVLDLRLELLDLGAAGRRCAPAAPTSSAAARAYQTPTIARPDRRRPAPRPAKKARLAALALLLPVGEQVDQDHCRNLRIARPQAVRYDGASRRSLLSRTARAELHVVERVDDHRGEAGQLGDALLQARQAWRCRRPASRSAPCGAACW